MKTYLSFRRWGILALVTDLLKALEARYQIRLRPLTQGSEARTFGADGLVFKVYSPTPTWEGQPAGVYAARLELLNMTKAGLADWVVEAFQINKHGILVSRRYPGHNFRPKQFSGAVLESLALFFRQLHQIKEPGVVSRNRLLARLDQFGGTLHDLPDAQQLVAWLRGHVDEVAGTPQAFCHRDPHAENVLIKDAGVNALAPETLVVDWVRAQADDPARDLAILTTGTLDLLDEKRVVEALQFIVQGYPDAELLWSRLHFWVPLTYLHDMHWFRTKEPAGFEAAVVEKMPKALRFYRNFNLL